MDDLEIIINADVQITLLSIQKHFCVPCLVVECINGKFYRPGFNF